VARVIGIDPGTVSIDICGLDDGRVFLDESFPTTAALADPQRFVARLESHAPVDLIAGPSGYGLPFVAGADLTETDLRLAFLAAEGEPGGIGGLRTLARALARSGLPVVFTPGVIHLNSVPPHRKINRVDIGTADKVCSTVLAVREQAQRRHCDVSETSFILLELGGAFTAAIAVRGGRIVDGVGGSSGPLGIRAAGALDGEVAFLAGHVSKSLIFSGGAMAVAGLGTADAFARAESDALRVAWAAYIDGAVKAVLALCVSAPDAAEVIVSGRMAGVSEVLDALTRRLDDQRASRTVNLRADMSIEPLTGFAAIAKQGAQGAALLADGLAGGREAALIESLGVRNAVGTLFDHLYVISPAQARARLGIG
jgi:predicted butyrate kinase (DUF1464 family)